MRTARFVIEPLGTAGFQQIKSPDHIRMNKIPRAGNRSVHVRLCGQMHHMRDLMLFHHAKHSRLVPQVHFFKCVLGMFRNALQIGRVARVRQAIQIYQPFDLGIFNNVLDQI